MPTVFALVLCGTVVTGDKGLLLCALGCSDGLVAYDGRGHGDDEWRMPPKNDRRPAATAIAGRKDTQRGD